MSIEAKRIRKLSLRFPLALAGAASAFILTPAAVAQSSSDGEAQKLERGPAVEHRQLDENGNQVLEWNELKPRLESAQLEREWDESKVMGEFDQNNDDGLGPLEYQMFLSRTGQDQGTGQQEVVVESQQPKVKVDTDPAQVEVERAQPEVAVDQKPPEVKVDPSDPQVTVDQKQPKVKVTQPKPEVQVTVPRPEVEVVQQDPDVNVEKNRPQVEIEQQEPEVTVNQGDPNVNVRQPDPEVAVEPARPQVSVEEDQQQANVDVQNQGDEAQVQVDQAEPEVQVSSSDPNVQVDSAEQADVEVEQQGQESQSTGEVASEDVNQLPPTAAGISSEEQQQTRQQQQAVDELRLDELEGQAIHNSQGERLGKVDQIVQAKEGNQAAVVMSSGGILGLGSSKVLVPLDKLSLEQDQLVWSTSKSTDEMKQSDYEPQNYTQVSTDNYEVVGDLKKAQ